LLGFVKKDHFRVLIRVVKKRQFSCGYKCG